MDKQEALSLVKAARGGYRNERSPYHAPKAVPLLCSAILSLIEALEAAEAKKAPAKKAPAKKAPAKKPAAKKSTTKKTTKKS